MKFKKILFLLLLISFVNNLYAIPNLPHAFYGSVTNNNGESLEIGCMICTEVNGNVNSNDCIITDKLGVYGINRKLIVQDVDSGSLIKFKIGSTYSNETSSYMSGNVDELNLTFTDANCLESTFDNGVIDGIEQCDNQDLDSATCVSLGFLSGTLSCNSSQGIYNTSNCITNEVEDPNTGGSTGSSSSGGSSGPGTIINDDAGSSDELDTADNVNNEPVNSDKDVVFILNTLDVDDAFGNNTSKDDLEVILEDNIQVNNNLDLSNIEVISSKLNLEKQQQLEEIRNLLVDSKDNKNLEVTTNIKIYKIKNTIDNKEVFRTKIELKLKAKDNLEKIVYIQEIPKNIAIDVLDIIFNIEPSEVLLNDPIVKWEFNNLKAGDTKDVSYYVKKKVDDISLVSLTSLVGVKETTTIDDDLISSDSENSSSDLTNNIILNKNTSSIWIYVIIIVILGLSALFFFKIKKSKN